MEGRPSDVVASSQSCPNRGRAARRRTRRLGKPSHDHPLRSGAREQGIGRWGAVQHAAIEQAPEDVLALLAAIEPVAVLIEVRLQMGGAHPVEDKDCGFSRSVLERTTASGPVGHADVPGWLALADVLWAAFAHSHEASLKLMEYMTMAKPVVAAGAGQAEQSIAEAGCGSAVARKDWEGLASEACRIAAADPDVRRQLGDNGRAWVTKNRDWQLVARAMLCGLDHDQPVDPVNR